MTLGGADWSIVGSYDGRRWERGVEGKQEISEEGQVRGEKVYKISEEGRRNRNEVGETER